VRTTLLPSCAAPVQPRCCPQCNPCVGTVSARCQPSVSTGQHDGSTRTALGRHAGNNRAKGSKSCSSAGGSMEPHVLPPSRPPSAGSPRASVAVQPVSHPSAEKTRLRGCSPRTTRSAAPASRTSPAAVVAHDGFSHSRGTCSTPLHDAPESHRSHSRAGRGGTHSLRRPHSGPALDRSRTTQGAIRGSSVWAARWLIRWMHNTSALPLGCPCFRQLDQFHEGMPAPCEAAAAGSPPAPPFAAPARPRAALRMA
jgi:hypothetical protein